MKIKVTTPLMTICDSDGKSVKGVKGCASEFEVAEKLSRLPPGKYLIIRPPIEVVVK
jgi:hypothetical protein